MKSILTIGEILVEIMATERGDGFLEPITLLGPFPSGAPAIFIDQAARFGQPAAISSSHRSSMSKDMRRRKPRQQRNGHVY